MKLLGIIADFFARRYQRACKHPGNMVTFDVAERTIENYDNVSHCKRCGAVRVGQGDWRLPDPLLWHGYERDLRSDLEAQRV